MKYGYFLWKKLFKKILQLVDEFELSLKRVLTKKQNKHKQLVMDYF